VIIPGENRGACSRKAGVISIIRYMVMVELAFGVWGAPVLASSSQVTVRLKHEGRWQ
jgi:hypothetical protein